MKKNKGSPGMAEKSKMKKVIDFVESNQLPLLVFFGSMFLFISFAGTRLFFSDEGIILDQFYNLINGSLALKIAKINVEKGIYMTIGTNLYGKFSYSLLILSLPTYYILKIIDNIYSAHLFILQLWAVIGGMVVFLSGKIRNIKHAKAWGVLTFFILIITNQYFFKSIYFPKWGELLSIEFTNIMISSFLILIIYLFFKNFFGNKIAVFASFFIMLATPISFYAITLKHHNLTLLLTLLSFYFFYKSYEKKDNKFIFLAYISAGLCVWTRILDGSVLLVSLMIIDIVIFRRSIKYISSVSIVILISLLPFFVFNYLILGDPFSIIESTPLTSEPVSLITAKDFIVLEANQNSSNQAQLLNDLGYTWTGKIKGYWFEIIGYSMFLKLVNTFGIFLVSPFLITALGFIVYGLRGKIKLNPADKLLGLYTILLFGTYAILHIFFNIRSLISIITDTPMSLDYRYLLILYMVFLYFCLRMDDIRELIEKDLKTILVLYCIIFIIMLSYFIIEFPVVFISSYYYMAMITSIFLLILISLRFFISTKSHKKALLNRSLSFIMALSLAEASFFLLFYYWVVSITYISPSQNYTIIPVMGNIINWMYQIIIY
jgi:4-amino-4-deoxy-L-arabinose transferase-like glycosyltransferase